MQLFRMSAEAEARRLTMIGIAVALCFAAVCLLVAVNPFGGKEVNRLSVVMDMPYVGQGIAADSPLVMHGVTVGKVTSVSSLAGGTVRLHADLDAGPAAGLTDTVGVDFRPANYFGVTGINLVAGQGGQPLRNGAHISTIPIGNFTLQALLSRMGQITGDVITPQLVGVINRVTRYTDGLNPLIETLVLTADSVTRVQKVSTEQLMRNATGISAAFPGFMQALSTGVHSFINPNSGWVTFNGSGRYAIPHEGAVVPEPGQPHTQEYWLERTKGTLDLVSNSFFGAVGRLLSSHPSDLLPVVNVLQSLTDTVPGLVTPVGINDMLVQLRSRFEKLYAGSPEQRALQVHLVLDQIPGVQAPVQAMGGPR